MRWLLVVFLVAMLLALPLDALALRRRGSWNRLFGHYDDVLIGFTKPAIDNPNLSYIMFNNELCLEPTSSKVYVNDLDIHFRAGPGWVTRSLMVLNAPPGCTHLWGRRRKGKDIFYEPESAGKCIKLRHGEIVHSIRWV